MEVKRNFPFAIETVEEPRSVLLYEEKEVRTKFSATVKGIRRATVTTFGCIAKAIGPQDVLATLLKNLKVQERVCTTVSTAIVAEICSPFTVLPALMNEDRVPDLNAVAARAYEWICCLCKKHNTVIEDGESHSENPIEVF
ncbi:hypothetical protein ACFX13_046978 [Malus domestica]